MKQQVETHVSNIGQGHVSAENYDNEGKEQERQRATIENQEKATIRGQLALNVQREERQFYENKENAHIISQQFALEQERLRASHIAKLPKPQSIDDEVQLNKIVDQSKKCGMNKPKLLVTIHDANVYASTRLLLCFYLFLFNVEVICSRFKISMFLQLANIMLIWLIRFEKGYF
jgi:hypothetical protein